jgi:glycosyltransferase involved in cell wall biosynthesis
MAKKDFVPHWFEFINTSQVEKYKIFEENVNVKYFSNVSLSPILRIAIFRDGSFLPPVTGMAYHVLNLARYLNYNNLQAIVFRCFRGWEDPTFYEKQDFDILCIHPNYFYNDIKFLLESIKKYNIDVAIFDDPEVIVLQGSILKNNLGVKIVYDMPNIDILLSKQLGKDANYINKQLKTLNDAFNYIDICWAKSENDKRELINMGVNKETISVNSIGVDTTIIPFKHRNIIPREVKGVFLGNLHYKPNIQALNYLQNLANECMKNRFPLNIYAIGDGNFTYLKKKFPLINFIGVVLDLGVALNNYDIAFCPIVTGSGASLKILDYLAAGIPIITTKVGVRGLSEEISKVVLLTDERELFIQVKYLVNNPKLYSELSLKGRQYVEEKHSWKSVIKKYIKTLEKITS